MTNHPNRSKKNPGPRSPKPNEIVAARERVGLTQSEAAKVIHSTLRAWQRWEGAERDMHPAFFELFQIKTAHLVK